MVLNLLTLIGILCIFLLSFFLIAIALLSFLIYLVLLGFSTSISSFASSQSESFYFSSKPKFSSYKLLFIWIFCLKLIVLLIIFTDTSFLINLYNYHFFSILYLLLSFSSFLSCFYSSLFFQIFFYSIFMMSLSYLFIIFLWLEF